MNIDPSNYMIAIVGYVIVFTALVLLYFVFSNLPKLLRIRLRRAAKKKPGDAEDFQVNSFMPGVENAAIATALYLFFSEMHDEESTRLTIKKVKKDYSPWSSRVHSIHTFQK